MKKIAIGTLKGGTGKTTVTFNLLGLLAEEHKVLAVDIDPQCNLSNNLGVDISDSEVFSCLDIFESTGATPKNLVVKAPIPQLPNLDLIPGNIKMVATELRIMSRAGREQILTNYMLDNKSYFGKYDYIVFDTNPSMNIINQNAFLAADSIVLVTDVDDNSRLGLKLFIDMWSAIRWDLKKKDNVKAIILNKADIRSKLTTQMYNYLTENEQLSGLFMEQMLRSKIVYPRAALAKLPMNLYLQVCGQKHKAAAQEAVDELRAVLEQLTERGVI